MNSVILIGNLTRDPELRYSTGANQTAVCRFSIAVNDGYGENERTSYPNIVVFGKQAENCERYLSKGRKVAINGRLQTGSYEKDGRKVYTTDVIASRVEFLGGGQGSQGGQSSFGNQGGQNSGGQGGSGFGGQGTQSFSGQTGQSFGGYEGGGQPAEGQQSGESIDVPGGFTSLQEDDIPF